MTPSKLPSAVVDLLQAVKRRDEAAFLAAFANDAVVSSRDAEYRGAGLRAWGQHLLQNGLTIQPINTVRRNGATVVTVVVKGGGKDTVETVAQLDWALSVADEKISGLTVAESILPDLPAPVASYVLATNTFNLQHLLDAFADDAIVNDQLREYRGISEISKWADRDIIGNRMTMYVVNVLQRHGIAVVVANVDGDFDKQGLPDPLVLSFYFTTHDNKIIQLIILRNEPDV